MSIVTATALGVKLNRGGLVVELGCDGIEKKGEEVAILFLAGSDG